MPLRVRSLGDYRSGGADKDMRITLSTDTPERRIAFADGSQLLRRASAAYELRSESESLRRLEVSVLTSTLEISESLRKIEKRVASQQADTPTESLKGLNTKQSV